MIFEKECSLTIPENFISDVADIQERVKKLQIKKPNLERHSRQCSGHTATPANDKKLKGVMSPKGHPKNYNASMRLATSPSN